MTPRKAIPAVKTSHDSIPYGAATIEFEVRRSKRRKKTIQLHLTEDGAVRVLAPWATTPERVRRMVLERARWIVDGRAQLSRRPNLRFVTGETVPYLGRNLTLDVTTADTPTVRVHRVGPEYEAAIEYPRDVPPRRRLDLGPDLGRLHITAPAHLEEPDRTEEVRQAVCSWYRDRAAEWLPRIVESWLPDFGRKRLPPVTIGNQRREWGNCAPDGTIRLSWRVVMLDHDLIDYVAIHELAHLRIRNHSAAFWRAVTHVHGDVRYTRERLRNTGRTLPL